MKDNPLDENYPQYNISELREDRDYWYEQSQVLHQSLIKQDKIIDDYRKRIKDSKINGIDYINSAISDLEYAIKSEKVSDKEEHVEYAIRTLKQLMSKINNRRVF